MRLLAPAVGLVCLACLGVTGCESFEIGGAKHATLTYTDDARAAYNEAMGPFRAREWEDAKALFAEVKRLFAYSRYARLAELRLADIEFEQEKFNESVTLYREFLTSHRNDPDIEYAKYRVTRALFKDIDDTIFLPSQEERDQATSFECFKEIRSFLRDFPKTRHRVEEQYMYDVVVGRLVRHELYVARYYLREEIFEATVARVDYALKTFPGSTLEPEALVLKGETFLKMKKIPEARALFERVKKEYGGVFVKTADRFLKKCDELESQPLRAVPTAPAAKPAGTGAPPAVPPAQPLGAPGAL